MQDRNDRAVRLTHLSPKQRQATVSLVCLVADVDEACEKATELVEGHDDLFLGGYVWGWAERLRESVAEFVGDEAALDDLVTFIRTWHDNAGNYDGYWEGFPPPAISYREDESVSS